MCGIYGITEHNPEFIKQFIDICKHRGPDGSSVWHNDSMTLGHNLLSIMGEPGQATQPWTTPKGNKLAYNGEIFNYYDLKEKIQRFQRYIWLRHRTTCLGIRQVWSSIHR